MTASPFSARPTPGPAPFAGRITMPVAVVALACLVAGLVGVAWLAASHADEARDRARLEAQGCGSALELQFGRAVSAAGVLGVLANQSGGAIPNFQKVAAGVMAEFPGLASCELQPGGVVSETVPRAGLERVLGSNAFTDPAQRAGAQEAMQRRVLTVSVPVTRAQGESGLVVRVPVYQRGRDGRDAFWGFVAVTMRLRDALVRARVEELPSRGYDYLLFAAGAGQQKPVAVVTRGGPSFKRAVQQPVSAHNAQLCLAVQPRSGWIDKPMVALGVLAALLLAGVFGLLVDTVLGRDAVESALADAKQRLDRESSEGKKAREELLQAKESASLAQAELKSLKAALQAAETGRSTLEARLSSVTQAADETSISIQTQLEKQTAEIVELRAQLESASRAAQEAAQTAGTKVKQTEQVSRDARARLEQAERAHEQAASAAQARLQQQQATIEELRGRLEEAAQQAREAAGSRNARLKQLEENNHDLRARLLTAEQTAAHTPELAARVRELQAELDDLRAKTGSPQTRVEAEPEPPTAEEISAEAEPETDDDSEAATEPESDRASVDVEDQAPAPEATEAESPVLPPTEEEAVPETAAAEPAPLPAAEPKPPSAPATPVPPPPARRRRARRDDQMDLFGPAAAAEKTAEVVAGPAPEAEEKREKPAPSRPLPPSPPLDLPELRKAVHLIIPLFAGQDPGAKDCLKDNRTTFRSAFSPEAYAEFEQLVRGGKFEAAMEQLKKAAKRHGIPV